MAEKLGKEGGEMWEIRDLGNRGGEIRKEGERRLETGAREGGKKGAARKRMSNLTSSVSNNRQTSKQPEIFILKKKR